MLDLVGWCCRRAGVGLGWRCSGDWGRGMMGGAAGLNPGAGGLRPGEGGGDSRCTRTPAHAHSRLPRRAAPGGRGPRDAPSPWVKCGGRRHAARSRQRLESKRRDFEAARFRGPPRCEVLQRRDAGPLRVAPRVVPHDVSAGGRVLRSESQDSQESSESQDARVRGTPDADTRYPTLRLRTRYPTLRLGPARRARRRPRRRAHACGSWVEARVGGRGAGQRGHVNRLGPRRLDAG